MKPLMKTLVDMMSDPAFMRRAERHFGASIGTGCQDLRMDGFKLELVGSKAFKADFDHLITMGRSPLDALAGAIRNLLPPEMRPQVTAFFDAIQNGISFVQTVALPALIALAPLIVAFVVGAFGQASTFVQGTLLPALMQLGGWIISVMIPALVRFAAIAGPQLSAGFSQLAMWAQQLAAFALPLLAQGFTLASQNMGIVLPILGAIALLLGLVLAPIIAIPAALILLGTAWTNNWGGIQEKTAAVWAIVQPILAGFVGFFGHAGFKRSGVGGMVANQHSCGSPRVSDGDGKPPTYLDAHCQRRERDHWDFRRALFHLE
jgi:hypothetical protein